MNKELAEVVLDTLLDCGIKTAWNNSRRVSIRLNNGFELKVYLNTNDFIEIDVLKGESNEYSFVSRVGEINLDRLTSELKIFYKNKFK